MASLPPQKLISEQLNFLARHTEIRWEHVPHSMACFSMRIRICSEELIWQVRYRIASHNIPCLHCQSANPARFLTMDMYLTHEAFDIYHYIVHSLRLCPDLHIQIHEKRMNISLLHDANAVLRPCKIACFRSLMVLKSRWLLQTTMLTCPWYSSHTSSDGVFQNQQSLVMMLSGWPIGRVPVCGCGLGTRLHLPRPIQSIPPKSRSSIFGAASLALEDEWWCSVVQNHEAFAQKVGLYSQYLCVTALLKLISLVSTMKEEWLRYFDLHSSLSRSSMKIHSGLAENWVKCVLQVHTLSKRAGRSWNHEWSSVDPQFGWCLEVISKGAASLPAWNSHGDSCSKFSSVTRWACRVVS